MLCALWLLALGTWLRPTCRLVLLAVVLAGSYGVVDEVHQLFVPGRSARVGDWLSDMAGIGLIAGVSLLPAGRRLLERVHARWS